MSRTESFAPLLDELHEEACKTYRGTREWELLQEKLAEMDRQRELNVAPGDRDFVEGCLETLLSCSGAESRYLYQKGLQDCVSLLKYLQVLA